MTDDERIKVLQGGIIFTAMFAARLPKTPENLRVVETAIQRLTMFQQVWQISDAVVNVGTDEVVADLTAVERYFSQLH